MKRKRNSSPALGNDYEVFLSFRGPDTRQTFTSCLYHRMKGVGIHVFRDDDELRVGEKISGALLQALDNSKIYIPIFSETYASSKWCLMELEKMLENTSKSEGKKQILPIFLTVEPDDVKLKTPLYSDALLKLEKKHGTDKVEAWRKALVEVDEIKGWTLKDQDHGEHIELIVKKVLMKLDIKYKNVTEQFVDDQRQKEAILELLDVESEGVRFVGLHGTGGIGKTTMAKVIFNELCSRFDHYCCFLEIVRNTSSQCEGIVYLQNKLLSTILGSRFVDEIHDTDDGINRIKQRLCGKKVLIVLDNLDEKEQLEKLAGKCDWFGSGSRIILTTREKSILNIEVGKSYGQVTPHSRGILPYEFQEMGFDQALQLFCKHAFRRDSPLEDYDNLSKQIVSTLGKLPLAIEVIGSYLSDSCMDQELWEETLKRIRKIPLQEVQKTLMISYDKLNSQQQRVFLDIACIFIGEDKTYPIFMWDDCGYFPLDAIKVLLCKSLITIEEDNTFWMHDQVRDLGRHIVNEKICRYPNKYSRVWTNKDASNILTRKEGNEDVEALSVSFSYYGEDRFSVTREDMASLKNLRFLRFFWTYEIDFVGDFRNLLPELRWLSLKHCSKDFTGKIFRPINLVVLELFRSEITDDWDGWSQIKMARKLKVLDLTECRYLTRTPNFSNFISLEILILADCEKLKTIDRSIGELKQLKTLRMDRCRSLQELPEEIGALKSLSEIILPDHCPNLLKLPETIGNLKALSRLVLMGSQINRLPDSIGRLVNLTTLSLIGCRKIKELPETIGELNSLVHLDLRGSGIVDLPDSIRNLKRLKLLQMTSTPKRKFPEAIVMLERLKTLELEMYSELRQLPEEIESLSRLRELKLSGADISKLSSIISRLSCLETLKLWNCNELRQLPEEIGSLSRLRELALIRTTISKLPSTISRLSCLERLGLSVCHELQQLPEEIGSLSKLRELILEDIPISTLPSTISRLSCLETLVLAECEKLEQLPEEIGSLSKLRALRLAYIPISTLPSTISRLSCLETLYLRGCDQLEQLPELPSSVRDLSLPWVFNRHVF